MKIKIEDIRCGNWFISQSGKPFQWSLQDFCLVAKGTELADIIKEPIKLTTQLLEKCCGFGWNENDYLLKYLGYADIYLGFFRGSIYKTSLLDRFGKKMHWGSNHMDTLHRLQNFYFNYSKTELPINLHELPINK